MRRDTVLVPIRILNGEYSIRCPSHKMEDLIEASKYLDEKMRKTRDESNIMSIDRIAIITALNIVGEHLDTSHELMNQKQLNASLFETFQQRLRKIKGRIDDALAENFSRK